MPQNEINVIRKSSLLKLFFLMASLPYNFVANDLKIRREMLCLRFAKRCLKIENQKKAFPCKKIKTLYAYKKERKYLIKNIETERYK